ncbi:oligosaccharide flippase family protein [Mycolicibacterium sp. CAU 1645]|uniref:Oligosaccharide flippase family protein n=2 Tax=Mycolicibacterium arenosum TaxID=2952157 RepID=A0ABT1M810_9MYCO|nr:oligosaccharide flippase family protein [Mycolicibacterium sp. CAU 1645]
MASTIATSALGYLFWLLAARLYDAATVGLVAALISASTALVLMASLGVGGTLIQTLPGLPRSRWTSALWTGAATTAAFVLPLSMGVVLLLPLVSDNMDILRSAPFACLFVVGTFCLAIGATIDYAFIADRCAKNMFWRNTLAAVLKVALLAGAGWSAAREALSLTTVWALSTLAGLILGLALIRRIHRFEKPPRPKSLARVAFRFRAAVTGHQLIGLGTGVVPYALPVIVTTRLSAVDNAYFYTTWMIAGLLFVVSDAVSQSLFAEGVHRKGTVSIYTSAARLIGVVLAIGIGSVLIFGERVLSTFGTAYASNGLTLLYIAVAASVPDAVTNVYVGILRVQRRLAAAATLNLAMGALTIGIAWFLLPQLGIEAVGWSFLAGQAFGCAYVMIDSLIQRRSQRATIEESS